MHCCELFQDPCLVVGAGWNLHIIVGLFQDPMHCCRGITGPICCHGISSEQMFCCGGMSGPRGGMRSHALLCMFVCLDLCIVGGRRGAYHALILGCFWTYALSWVLIMTLSSIKEIQAHSGGTQQVFSYHTNNWWYHFCYHLLLACCHFCLLKWKQCTHSIDRVG